MRRKFESADPLRRGTRRPPASAIKAAAARNARAAGAKPAGPAAGATAGKPGVAGAVPPTQPAPGANLPQASVSDLTKRQPPADMATAGFQEFALKMCDAADLANARYHVLKFYSRTAVDPAAQFTPPIRLHRKDPRQLQVVAGQEDPQENAMDVEGAGGFGSSAGSGAGGSGAGGAMNADGSTSQFERAKKRPFGNRRKTRQIHGGEKNEAARKLRYEEHYPWVMEDFDNKNTWVSSYEAAQSNNFVVLAYDASSNGFKVIPIEKYYKMTPSARYATLSLEDAEERMESAHSMRDRWLMSNLQPRVSATRMPTADQLEAVGPAGRGRLRTVVGSEDRQHKYNMEEEMDYDDQEMFDDDEGAPLLEGPEEELKEAERRIKQEHLKANELMDLGREHDIDNLFEEDETREDRQGRRVRKALRSLEKNQYYDTDDEDNPYVSEEEDEEDEEELELSTKQQLQQQIQQQQEEQQQQQQQQQQGAHPGTEADSHLPDQGLKDGSQVKPEIDVGINPIVPLVPSFRKRHIDRSSLPRGMIILQLPPAMLGNFPKGVWNPNIKRDDLPVPAASADLDPNLLTKEDVRSHIVSGETDIKQLLNALKPKLTLHPDNINRLKQLVKEVARSKNKKLYLR